MFGQDDCNGHSAEEIYLIDFGLACFYRDLLSVVTIPSEMNQKFMGTPNFASLSAHIGTRT
jgi:serine/threonine protein kinase